MARCAAAITLSFFLSVRCATVALFLSQSVVLQWCPSRLSPVKLKVLRQWRPFRLGSFYGGGACPVSIRCVTVMSRPGRELRASLNQKMTSLKRSLAEAESGKQAGMESVQGHYQE